MKIRRPRRSGAGLEQTPRHLPSTLEGWRVTQRLAFTIAVAAFATAAWGCAEAASSDDENDSSDLDLTMVTDAVDEDTVADATDSGPDAEMVLDLGEETADTAVPQDMSSVDADAMKETTDALPDGAVCAPGTTQCIGAGTLGTCSSDGMSLDMTSCATGETCSDGECQAPMTICTAGEATCSDWDRAVQCSADGTQETPTLCGEDDRCIGGACRAGAPTGSPCTSDDECGGASCICPEGCQGGLSAGYCSTLGCADGCAPNEHCVTFGLGGRTDPDRCLLDCASCTRGGLSCRELPRFDGSAYVWEIVCYDPDSPADIGAECDGDAVCAGGLCLTESPNGEEVRNGYCSSPCSDDTECPSYASCIKVGSYRDGAGFCVLDCEDSSCPGERNWPLAITCLTRPRADGSGSQSVCFQP